MMRRDADDKEWQRTKKQVNTRDHRVCRLLAILTIKEDLMIRRIALIQHKQSFIKYLDPAHIFSVKLFAHLIYESLNVITLNRFAHELLDNNINPLTGKSISKEERNNFFKRIIGKKKFAILSKWAHNPELYEQEKQNEIV